MTKPAAFQATYSDFKLVKTRKVAQLIFEVPLEAVDEAYKVLGGMPNPADERWFGIAPLKKEVAPNPDSKLSGQHNDSHAQSAEPTERGKKSWRDLPPSQQAAIRCEEPIFQTFLKEEHADVVLFADQDAAQAVRDLCCVTSRSELNTNHEARVLWTQLESQFQAWKTVDA